MEFSAYTRQWRRADGTIVGVQDKGDLEVKATVALDEEKHKHLLILIGFVVGGLLLTGLAVAAILNSNWQNNSDNQVKIEKSKACQSIENDETRALCVSNIE